MFLEEDKEFLDNPDYSMPLEKFFYPKYYELRDYYDNDSAVFVNGTVDHTYQFSNEQLKKIFSHLPRKKQKLLTVGSSGDQALNAIFYGYKDITIIDANIYTRHWVEYKFSAIKNLDYLTFKKYFLRDKKSCLKPEVYTKIFQDLSLESQVFWGTILLDQIDNEELIKMLFQTNDCKIDAISSSFYFDKQNYEKLQEILKKNDFSLKIIESKFSDFPKATKEKYDVILLSNVYKYVKPLLFKEVMNELYEKNLNNNGIIQLHYDFRYFNGHPFDKRLIKQGEFNCLYLENLHSTYFLKKTKRLQKEKTK